MTSAAADDQVPGAQVVSLLRERLSGAISCPATLAVLDGDTSAWARAATGGLVLGVKILAH